MSEEVGGSSYQEGTVVPQQKALELHLHGALKVECELKSV